MKIQCYGRKKRRKVTLVILYILKCLYSVFFIRNSLFCILYSIFSNLYSVFCSCIGGGGGGGGAPPRPYQSFIFHTY
jgi:hypothetical protein